MLEIILDNNQQNNKSNLQVSVNENHNITHTVNLLQYIQVRQWGHLGHTSTSFRHPETPFKLSQVVSML